MLVNKLQTDKGDGTVIIDRDVYIQSVINRPNNHKGRPTEAFLRSMKDKNIFIKKYEKIYSSGSKPVFIYGTPKIHKLKHNINELSLRPIMSSIGTYNYLLLQVHISYLKRNFMIR